MSYALRNDVRYRLLLNEAVVIRQDAAEVVGLNLVGARVLELIDRGFGENQILTTIAEEFDVAKRELEPDVSAFLGELVQLEIIERLETTGGPN